MKYFLLNANLIVYKNIKGERGLKMKKNKLGAGLWLNLILFGFMGQIAWNVENMYFNTFLYNSVYNGASQNAVNSSLDVMSAISIMVALSAATAVITTFLIGTLSDKLGKRKIFISLGYVLWGITTGAFGFISTDNTASLFNISDEVKVLTLTVSTVIIMDCIMTFMGSTSNDAAFNAWVTDVTNTKNRATAESVLAILPVLAMVAVMGLSGIAATDYSKFFIVLGAVVSVCGLIGMFTIKDSGDGIKKDTPYFKELFYGFKPEVIKENSRLYLSLAAVCIFSTAVQVFFPYIFIYLTNGLGFDLNSLMSNITTPVLICAPIVLIAVIALIVIMGRLIDKIGKDKFIVVSVILFILGLILTGFANNLSKFLICVIVLLAGYALLMIMLNAAVRDFTPEGKVGLFQGVRMIFVVLIPMVVGPVIGNVVCRVSSFTYINDYGVETSAPGNVMFFAAAAVAVLIVIPLVFLIRKGFDPEKQ